MCGQEAGVLRFEDEGTAAGVVRSSFTSQLTGRVEQRFVEAVRQAVLAADARTLYSLDPEYVPFYCPTCDASFCGEHWLRWDVFDDDGWHDSIRGRCPKDHERMLED